MSAALAARTTIVFPYGSTPGVTPMRGGFIKQSIKLQRRKLSVNTMKINHLTPSFREGLLLAVLLTTAGWLQAQPVPNWEAFHDHSPGALTSPNATGGKLRVTGDTAILKKFESGEDLSAVVTVEAEGVPDDFGARGGALNEGSPARVLFDGKVDLSNDFLPGVHADVKITLVFSGLDPSSIQPGGSLVAG